MPCGELAWTSHLHASETSLMSAKRGLEAENHPKAEDAGLSWRFVVRNEGDKTIFLVSEATAELLKQEVKLPTRMAGASSPQSLFEAS